MLGAFILLKFFTKGKSAFYRNLAILYFVVSSWVDVVNIPYSIYRAESFSFNLRYLFEETTLYLFFTGVIIGLLISLWIWKVRPFEKQIFAADGPAGGAKSPGPGASGPKTSAKKRTKKRRRRR